MTCYAYITEQQIFDFHGKKKKSTREHFYSI